MSDYRYIENPSSVVKTSPWVAREGSVFTTQLVRLRCPSGKTVQVAVGVAYNVGSDVAEHLVRLHNAELSRQ